jgi:formamidopyrimidine-DNA glycosylase
LWRLERRGGSGGDANAVPGVHFHSRENDADEILWEAQINPYLPKTKLSEVDLRRLYRAALAVMAWATPLVRASMVKGDTLDYEERRDFMRVHRLGGHPCPRCGSNITEITANQRITSFCRTCQPESPA